MPDPFNVHLNSDVNNTTSNSSLAIDGGSPVRDSFLPYAMHWIGEEEKEEVLSVLNSNWLTTGPKVKQFEEDVARYVGTKYAIAVNSGTAALHCCLAALDIKPGDEVITTPFTFLATANAIIYLGGTPILADIDEKTYNISPSEIRKKITPRTKAIIPVHYGGLPCEMDEILNIAREFNLKVIEDAAHALSAEYNGKRIGSLGDATIFSFHPVKNITTAEGGMIVTNNPEIAKYCIMHRTHGITKEAMERYGKNADWMYDMQRIGYRYNMTEFQAALGVAQLRKLESFQRRREEIANRYDQEFSQMFGIILPPRQSNLKTAWHLYPLRLQSGFLAVDRNQIIKSLKAENIGVNVHYIPLHLHTYYQKRYGFVKGDFPVAEKVYDSILTIPLFPKMSDEDVNDVITAFKKVFSHYQKKTIRQDYPLTITGENIKVVPFVEHHLRNPCYLSWLRDPEVMIYARRDFSSAISFDDALKYVQSLWNSTQDYFFAIETLPDNTFIGTLKLGHIDWRAGVADLGIMVGDKIFWGKGLATSACSLALAYAFEELGMNKVIIGCKEPNLGMIKVAQKLGFTQEGYLRENNFFSGQRSGHYYFGLLRREYLLQKIKNQDSKNQRINIDLRR